MTTSGVPESETARTPPRLSDAGGLDEVVRELTPMVRGIVRRFRLSSHREADLTQDIWLLLVQHADSIQDPARIRGWLRTTANREAIRAASRDRREFSSEQVTDDGVAATSQVADEVSRSQRDDALWRVIDRLPARDKLLLELIAHRPELNNGQLAMRLRISPASLGKVRARCFRRLRRKLAVVGITDARF